jgi:hypothetical protein
MKIEVSSMIATAAARFRHSGSMLETPLSNQSRISFTRKSSHEKVEKTLREVLSQAVCPEVSGASKMAPGVKTL